MKLAVLCVVALLAGCAQRPELVVLVGPKRIEGDSQVGVTLLLLQRFGEHGTCGYAHASDPQHGGPFNNEPDMVFDSVGCGVRWGGK